MQNQPRIRRCASWPAMNMRGRSGPTRRILSRYRRGIFLGIAYVHNISGDRIAIEIVTIVVMLLLCQK